MKPLARAITTAAVFLSAFACGAAPALSAACNHTGAIGTPGDLTLSLDSSANQISLGTIVRPDSGQELITVGADGSIAITGNIGSGTRNNTNVGAGTTGEVASPARVVVTGGGASFTNGPCAFKVTVAAPSGALVGQVSFEADNGYTFSQPSGTSASGAFVAVLDSMGEFAFFVGVGAAVEPTGQVGGSFTLRADYCDLGGSGPDGC